jgi:hypothetical protein
MNNAIRVLCACIPSFATFTAGLVGTWKLIRYEDRTGREPVRFL